MKDELTEQTIAPDPIMQFQKWFDDALARNIPDANAMMLATATREGRVSARIVLLKGFDERGFCFFTNFLSAKGKQLTANASAALVFFWQALERQVRIEGTVSRMSDAEADAYFRTRPHGSQIGAWASPQSEVISNRAFLEKRVEESERKYGENVPRPSHWGGYRLEPLSIEFWQGRADRMHDRLIYRKSAAGDWHIERLAP